MYNLTLVRVLFLGFFCFSERITIWFVRPPPYSGIPPTTITHILWRISQKLLARF